MRRLLMYRGEGGYWGGGCPGLPGCISEGRSRDEALENVKEAIRGSVASLEEDAVSVPEETFESMVVAV